MKCPACYNELTEIQVGNIRVDVCQDGCAGIWFDAFELQKMDEQHEPGEPLLHLRPGPGVVVNSSRKRECPRCAGVKLHRHFFSPKRRVQVDECPNCGGYWLDAGELAQIRAEKTTAQELAEAGSTTVSVKFIRYLYQFENRAGTGEKHDSSHD